MAKKLINLSIFALILTLLWLFAVQSVSAIEPTYNGKGLSEWLLLNLKAEPSAEDAILQIGTNGIPTLIDILGVKESNKKKVLAELKSDALKQEFNSKDANLEDLRGLAVDGFAILGTNAESAVPQLTKLFRNSDTCYDAARALTQVGSKGVAVLADAMNDENRSAAVVLAFGQHGNGDPKVITQLLTYALKNQDPVTRGNAARFLTGKDASVAVPALMPMLEETDFYPLNGAIIALGSYGKAAKIAAPKIFILYTNAVVGKDRKLARDLGVQMMTTLREIDPETAGRAEAFLINSGPLNFARFGYTETLLPNGKELIAGGIIHTEFPTIKNRYLSSAEIYNPKTGKWTETGEMNFARGGHTATMQPDGKVLVTGGYGPGGVGQPPILSSKELYDPAMGMWTVITNK